MKIDNVKQINQDIKMQAKAKLDSLSKPLGSLGILEEIVFKICSISNSIKPDISKKVVAIFCADNGVVEEGVSQVGSEITKIVANNFTKNITAINNFTKYYNQDIFIYDVGINTRVENQKIINKKVMFGTNNIAKGPAMTKEEALKAINIGIDSIKSFKDKGYTIVATGEMGIGNTTTSSAITAVLSNNSVELVTGKGAGLSNQALDNKIKVIKNAIFINNPDKDDPIDVLSKLGGLDIAAMCGCFIGGAVYGIPIVIDGFISSVAALLAFKICPECREFMIPSHGSYEPGSKFIYEELGLKPALFLDMRLGEGTGASIMMGIIDLAFNMYYNMGTFDDAKIKQYEELK